eukprot:8089419-Pyramimonas_sp.AAC.1
MIVGSVVIRNPPPRAYARTLASDIRHAVGIFCGYAGAIGRGEEYSICQRDWSGRGIRVVASLRTDELPARLYAQYSMFSARGSRPSRTTSYSRRAAREGCGGRVRRRLGCGGSLRAGSTSPSSTRCPPPSSSSPGEAPACCYGPGPIEGLTSAVGPTGRWRTPPSS